MRRKYVAARTVNAVSHCTVGECQKNVGGLCGIILVGPNGPLELHGAERQERVDLRLQEFFDLENAHVEA